MVKVTKIAKPVFYFLDEFLEVFHRGNVPYVALDRSGCTWAEAPNFYGRPANEHGAMGRKDFNDAWEAAREEILAR